MERHRFFADSVRFGPFSRMHPPSVSRRIFVLALAATTAVGTALLTRSTHALQSAPSAEASPQFYTEHVQPIFQANCYRCHAGLNHRGGLHLDTREGLMRGGKDGAVVVPGHPEQSLLVTLIRHQGPANDPRPMPPKSKLSDADIATVTEWIRAGAVMPPDQAH
jgi:mono/diheme cytochrome c family protein